MIFGFLSITILKGSNINFLDNVSIFLNLGSINNVDNLIYL